MSASRQFDPYYKWLGIPPKDQPPNHYRLLGLERFESDCEVIDAAANRLMAYLQDLATGEGGKHSQKLLNEVAAARVCLLDEKRKAAYDAELRTKVAAEPPAPPPAPPGGPPAPPKIATAEPLGPVTAAALPSVSPKGPGKGGRHRCPRCGAALTARGAVCKACGRDSALSGSAAQEPRGPAPIVNVAAEESAILRSPSRRKRAKPSAGASGSHPGLERRRSSRKKSGGAALIWAGVGLAMLLGLIVLASQGGDPPPPPERPAGPRKPQPERPSGASTLPKPARPPRYPNQGASLPYAEPRPLGELGLPSAGEPGGPDDRVMSSKPHRDGNEESKQPPESAGPPSGGSPRAGQEKPPKPKTEKPPERAKDPFRELPERVQLPEWKRGDESEAAIGGPIDVPSPAAIRLTITENPDEFGLKKIDGQPAWDVVTNAAEAGPIARFRLNGQRLKFRWAPRGPRAVAERLRNCSLVIAADDKSREVSLRSAQQAAPLPIRQRNANQFTVAGLPPGTVARLELGELTGPISAASMSSGKVFEAGRNTTIQLAGEHAAGMKLRVKFERDGMDRFVVHTELGLGQGPRFVPFDGEEVEQEVQSLKQRIRFFEAEVQKSRNLKGQVPEPVMLRYQQTRAPLDARLAVLTPQLNAAQTLREKCRLHFRIVAEIDGKRVELVRSGEGPK